MFIVMENISDVMGFGPYAENNEGQPRPDNGLKKPIGMADDKYCRQCGEKRGENSSFCSNCGAKFG